MTKKLKNSISYELSEPNRKFAIKFGRTPEQNFQITRDVYPLLSVDDSLAALSDMAWFSTMDMTDGSIGR